MISVSVCLTRHCSHLCSNMHTAKNHAKEISQTLWKSIRDSVKSRCFLRFHNGSRNMFVNARDVNWFFIFPIMLLEQLSKHVHMYCRFQGTLMSNISFILKHHCVETVQIRSYLWSVFSCIQSEYRKIRTRNKSVFG